MEHQEGYWNNYSMRKESLNLSTESTPKFNWSSQKPPDTGNYVNNFVNTVNSVHTVNNTHTKPPIFTKKEELKSLLDTVMEYARYANVFAASVVLISVSPWKQEYLQELAIEKCWKSGVSNSY